MPDIFQQDPAEVIVPPVDHQKNYKDELIGEGKRYKTEEDAAKALVEKDNFIEQLKRENASMRETVGKRMNEEEFLAKLEQITKPKSPEAPEQQDQRDERTPAMTPERIEQLIDQREVTKKRAGNIAAVESTLAEVYGPSWKARVKAEADRLGIGTEYLTDVAGHSPEAFYNVIGLKKTQTSVEQPAPPRNTVELRSSPTGGKKDYTHYSEERKKRGESWYFSIPVQQEIWQEAKTQGESFYARTP